MQPNHFETFSSYIPIDLGQPLHFLMACGLIYAIVVFRYFLIVAPFQFVFYKWRPQWTRRRQIYPQLPSGKEQWFEIKWSIVTSLIFAVSGAVLGLIWQKGWTQIYLKFDQYGWLYFFVISPLLLLLLHETYFYWTHRWLHHPWFYRKYHGVHHASLRPSGWASFSFHPVESLINAAAIPLIVLILPVHPVLLLVHLTLMTLTAVTNHLGFEVLPSGSARHWLGRWLISGVHHTEHHRYFRYNFGLFFTFWDVWMKTEHVKYQEEFDKVFQSQNWSQTRSQPETEASV